MRFRIRRDVIFLLQLILSSCSGYFDELLNGISPLQHPVIFLTGVPFWVLKCLIDFMYAGEVHIEQNRLEALLKVAEMLQVCFVLVKLTVSVIFHPFSMLI